ncbi:MAG: adenylate/guanylate cyclase domain-containing protein [Betaproteobacteria bacterium]|nr:adenylate/guanylate cyclase domain-containing protein [Betaproteobacteria bacterium]
MTRETVQRAVMFADITGSTRLFSTLGDRAAREVIGTFVRLNSSIARQFDGALVKGVGDAALCLFNTPDNALLAASALQAELAASPLAGQTVRTHIGFSFGSIVAEESDVFGDTVNIASHLSDIASPEQILTTEATYDILSAPLRDLARPIFRTNVKGSGQETTVCEVLWRNDPAVMTQLNPVGLAYVPHDEGAMMLEWGDGALRLDAAPTRVLIGRGPHCDIVVDNRFASREHACIKQEGNGCFLEDTSTNGTFVAFDDGRQMLVLRREVPLEGSGRIFPGTSPGDGPRAGIRFHRERCLPAWG